MSAGYGFTTIVTAKPGKGDELIELFRSGMDEGNPAASEHCLVYLVCRSVANPDLLHVTEGWTTEEDHARLFAGPAAQAIVAKAADLVVGQSPYHDFVPVAGKAAL